MKAGSAVCSGVVLLSLLASSCTRNTPANTSSDQAQPASQAQATAETSPQPSPSIAAGGPAEPEKPAAKTKKSAPDQQTPAQPTEQTAAPAPPPPSPVVLPAGTLLSVRVNETIDTKTSSAGDKFTGSVVEPVPYKDRTAIPAGSVISGTVEQSKQGGKVKGSSTLSLRLTSLTVKGMSYAISTGSFLQEGKGKGSRTAKMAGGGAAAGAVVGGIAGGGKGALIGSAVGGGAGAAGSAFTGNKELTIPAESVLQFKLAQPLKLSTENTNPVNSPNQR